MTINIPTPSLTSWKTTLSGVASVVLGVLQASKHTTLSEIVNDPLVWFALVIALLGFFAKDGNVTGGTTGQPSTQKALAEANQAPAAGAAAPKE
jgi:hypothetical protein